MRVNNKIASKKHLSLTILFIFCLSFTAKLLAEQFTELSVDGDTWLATDSDNVGIGTITPNGKLNIVMPDSGYQGYDSGIVIDYPDGYPNLNGRGGLVINLDNYEGSSRDFIHLTSKGTSKFKAKANGDLFIEGDIDAANLGVLHYNTGNSSEKVTSLPIATSAGAAQRKVIFSQQLTGLEEGEIIQVMSEFQVTEDNTYNVGFTSYTTLATTSTTTTGVEITEANGENITNNMHHQKRVIVGTYEVKSTDVGTRYINIVGYAYSTAAASGHTLTVNQDYGRLSVMRFEPRN